MDIFNQCDKNMSDILENILEFVISKNKSNYVDTKSLKFMEEKLVKDMICLDTIIESDLKTKRKSYIVLIQKILNIIDSIS